MARRAYGGGYPRDGGADLQAGARERAGADERLRYESRPSGGRENKRDRMPGFIRRRNHDRGGAGSRARTTYGGGAARTRLLMGGDFGAARCGRGVGAVTHRHIVAMGG